MILKKKYLQILDEYNIGDINNFLDGIRTYDKLSDAFINKYSYLNY